MSCPCRGSEYTESVGQPVVSMLCETLSVCSRVSRSPPCATVCVSQCVPSSCSPTQSASTPCFQCVTICHVVPNLTMPPNKSSFPNCHRGCRRKLMMSDEANVKINSWTGTEVWSRPRTRMLNVKIIRPSEFSYMITFSLLTHFLFIRISLIKGT